MKLTESCTIKVISWWCESKHVSVFKCYIWSNSPHNPESFSVFSLKTPRICYRWSFIDSPLESPTHHDSRSVRSNTAVSTANKSRSMDILPGSSWDKLDSEWRVYGFASPFFCWPTLPLYPPPQSVRYYIFMYVRHVGVLSAVPLQQLHHSNTLGPKQSLFFQTGQGVGVYGPWHVKLLSPSPTNFIKVSRLFIFLFL